MQTDTESQENVSIVKWFDDLVWNLDGLPIGFSLAPSGSCRNYKLTVTCPTKTSANPAQTPPGAADAPRLDYIK